MSKTVLTRDEPLVATVAIVLTIHLVANVAHTITHIKIPVLLDPLATIFILLAHYLLPIIGVILLWNGSETVGAAVFFLSMIASFTLQVFLHFLVSNPDNGASVPAGQWQLSFQLTAVALVLVEGLGVVLGGWLLLAQSGSPDDVPQSGRITGVPNSGVRPLPRLIYWFSRRWMGEVLEPLMVTAHHRSILAGTGAFEMSLDHAGRVDERLKELAVVKAAMLIGCEFCIDIGSSQAAKLGISDEQLQSLTRFEESGAFSELERLVLRYAVAITVTPTNVPDELFEKLNQKFDEAELVELTAVIAFENYRGRFNHAFGIGSQGFSEGEFCPLPETPPTPSDRHPDSQ